MNIGSQLPQPVAPSPNVEGPAHILGRLCHCVGSHAGVISGECMPLTTRPRAEPLGAAGGALECCALGGTNQMSAQTAGAAAEKGTSQILASAAVGFPACMGKTYIQS